MKISLESAAELIAILSKYGIDPVLYGSLGVSVYLGPIKQFGDIDLLVESSWVSEKWPRLVEAMNDVGFHLVDEHEHEFKDIDGASVAFAAKSILYRDKIITSDRELVWHKVGELSVRTLEPRAFRRAYEFSRKDGYRRKVRQKNDNALIELLAEYIKNEAN